VPSNLNLAQSEASSLLRGRVVTVSSSDYRMLIGYVVSGAVLWDVWAEFSILATNGTEAVVNESRAELYNLCVLRSRATLVELIGRVERPVSWVKFSVSRINEMIYESGHVYLNTRTLNGV